MDRLSVMDLWQALFRVAKVEKNFDLLVRPCLNFEMVKQYSDEAFEVNFAPSFQFNPWLAIPGWSYARLTDPVERRFEEHLTPYFRFALRTGPATQVQY